MISEKELLRRRIMRELQLPEQTYLIQADKGIAENLFSTPEYRAAKTIYTYLSVEREPDTRNIIARALTEGKTVALPVCEPKGIMYPRRLSSLADLISGTYGIPVPPETEPKIDENELDVIIVPAVAYDVEGFRLGRGGGYYDRLLSRCGAYSVGLARERQLVWRVPREAHDQAVDCLITEKTVARLR